jgi:tripartite-type tricarboxylate transporter receptor subunit TctC
MSDAGIAADPRSASAAGSRSIRARLHRHRLAGLLLAMTGGLVAAAPTLAQWSPTKPIRFIVPFPPGGGNDLIARELAVYVAEPLGQPVIVDNRPGGSTIIGTEAAARAAPDGHTIFMGNNSTLTINPNLYRKLPYDALRDFAPISLLASSPFVLIVHPSLPARSVKELIALARSKPGQLNFGSAGTGITTHLAGELFKIMAHVDIVHIPYKGAGPALTDLIAGQIDMVFNNLLSALPHVRSGRVRALGVTSTERNPALPQLPTLAEAGLAGYEAGAWYAVLAPARTPPPVIARLHTEFVKALRQPKVQERMAADGARIIGSTPEVLARTTQTDIARWGRVIKQTGLKLETPQ